MLGGLHGKRIFIVEDEFFLAWLLQDELQELGCEPLGPYTNIAKAIEASREQTFDVAILDINLNGEMVFPLADELASRGIPFVFMTGYASNQLPQSYRKISRLQKPFNPGDIGNALRRLLV